MYKYIQVHVQLDYRYMYRYIQVHVQVHVQVQVDYRHVDSHVINARIYSTRDVTWLSANPTPGVMGITHRIHMSHPKACQPLACL